MCLVEDMSIGYLAAPFFFHFPFRSMSPKLETIYACCSLLLVQVTMIVINSIFDSPVLIRGD